MTAVNITHTEWINRDGKRRRDQILHFTWADWNTDFLVCKFPVVYVSVPEALHFDPVAWPEICNGGGSSPPLSPLPFPLYSHSLPFSLPLPSLPLEVGPLKCS